MYHTGARIRKDSDFRELFQVGTEDVALHNEIGESALALDLYQASSLQLLYVMGKCRGADAVVFLQIRAGREIATCADFLHHLIASRLSQSARDPRKLQIGKAGAVGLGHSSKGSV